MDTMQQFTKMLHSLLSILAEKVPNKVYIGYIPIISVCYIANGSGEINTN